MTIMTITQKNPTEMQEFLQMFGVDPKDAYDFVKQFQEKQKKAVVVDDTKKKKQDTEKNKHFPGLQALPKKASKEPAFYTNPV